MRICENIAAALVAVTVPAGFVAVLGIEADKGAWAYWLIVLVMVLQLTAMGLVKMGARSPAHRVTLPCNTPTGRAEKRAPLP